LLFVCAIIQKRAEKLVHISGSFYILNDK